MNELEYIKAVQYKYVVIYHAKSDYIENYNPIINISNVRDFTCGQTMHIWDDELNGIIPAIWYIMHLPRNAFDTSSCDIDFILMTKHITFLYFRFMIMKILIINYHY